MKTLKEFLTEGILDIEDNIENLTRESLIEDFIKENYNTAVKIQIKKNGNKHIVSTKGFVEVKNNNITELTNGLFEWDEVKSFSCRGCTSLKDLTGAPEEVGRNFNCSRCSSLESLKGAPKKVGRDFSCIECTSLKDLTGAPEEVKFDFTCMECTSLESLKGAPKKVGRDFYCSGCTSLKDLIGAPEKVGRDFIYNRCGKKFTEEDVRAVCDVEDEIYI